MYRTNIRKCSADITTVYTTGGQLNDKTHLQKEIESHPKHVQICVCLSGMFTVRHHLVTYLYLITRFFPTSQFRIVVEQQTFETLSLILYISKQGSNTINFHEKQS